MKIRNFQLITFSIKSTRIEWENSTYLSAAPWQYNEDASISLYLTPSYANFNNSINKPRSFLHDQFLYSFFTFLHCYAKLLKYNIESYEHR